VPQGVPAADPLVPAAVPCPVCPVSPSATPRASNGVVDALAALLARTKSKDTFTTAVMALGQLGAEARVALPAIIENAERLGVLKGAFGQGGSKSGCTAVVLEAVAAIAGGKAPQPGQACCQAGAAPGPVCEAVPAPCPGCPLPGAPQGLPVGPLLPTQAGGVPPLPTNSN
jgi:hypothetical protein